MKIFSVDIISPGCFGVDTVACNDISEIKPCLEQRVKGEFAVSNVREISTQQMRVGDITVGDLLKLIQGENICQK
jgi:uncharacterized membrane protein (UPF0127 family)